MAIVEDVSEEDEQAVAGPSRLPTTAATTSSSPKESTNEEKSLSLQERLSRLIASLQVPEELQRLDKATQIPHSQLDQFKYDSLQTFHSIHNALKDNPNERDSLDDEALFEIKIGLIRYDGVDDWCSGASRKVIQDCLTLLPSLPTSPTSISIPIPIRILSQILKPLFSSTLHPSLNPETARALARPMGGEGNGKTDMFENQGWKDNKSNKWALGSWNLFRWAVGQMTSSEIESYIHLILPPLLTLLDDYESIFRLRGMDILEVLLDKGKFRSLVMKRMGVDKLLINSIQSSIALHPTYPSPILLPRSLSTLTILLNHLYPKRSPSTSTSTSNSIDPNSSTRAEEYSRAVEGGIINGWQYIPSGWEGLEGMKGVAKAVEILCSDEAGVGVGVVRWLRSFIPSLLIPLSLPPSPFSLSHQLSNLKALHTLLSTIASTGRAARWRGQILDGVGRCWLGVSEKLVVEVEEDEEREELEEVKEACVLVVQDLLLVEPSVKTSELPQLVSLDKGIFAPLLEAVS